MSELMPELERTSQTRPSIVGTDGDGQRSRRSPDGGDSAPTTRIPPAAGDQAGASAVGTGPHLPARSARFVPVRGRRGSAPHLILGLQICLIPICLY
jgi:hypothetical protein